MHNNLILTSGNGPLIVTNLAVSPGGLNTLSGLPLGTSDGSATGEVAVKVFDVSEDKAVTPSFMALGASGSQVIPAGAKGYSIQILTGSGTIGGAAVTSVFSLVSHSTLAASLTVTTNATSSAFVAWNI